MKIIIILMGVLLLLACHNESASSGQSAKDINNHSSEQLTSNGLQTAKVNTKGVDLSVFMNADSICSVISESKLNTLFNVPEKIVTEVEKSGATVNCQYSWRYDSLEARQKATDTGIQYDFGRQIIYNARAISNEAKLVISLAPVDKTAAQFVPEIMSVTEIEAVVESDLARLKNQMAHTTSKEAYIRLDQMAEKRKRNLIQRNQQNNLIKDVGDAAYWNHSGVGGLHVLIGHVEVYISPFIATNTEADVINAITVLAKIVE